MPRRTSSVIGSDRQADRTTAPRWRNGLGPADTRSVRQTVRPMLAYFRRWYGSIEVGLRAWHVLCDRSTAGFGWSCLTASMVATTRCCKPSAGSGRGQCRTPIEGASRSPEATWEYCSHGCRTSWAVRSKSSFTAPVKPCASRRAGVTRVLKPRGSACAPGRQVSWHRRGATQGRGWRAVRGD